MEISKEDERPNVVMMARDKDDINKFASCLARRNELRVRIERRKKLIQLHEDASDELVIMDDEAEMFYNVGDVFIMDDKVQIEASLEKVKQNLDEEVAGHQKELDNIEKEMLTLKASLYAKFGKVRLLLFIYFHSFLFASVSRLFSNETFPSPDLSLIALPPCHYPCVNIKNRRLIWRNDMI